MKSLNKKERLISISKFILINAMAILVIGYISCNKTTPNISNNSEIQNLRDSIMEISTRFANLERYNKTKDSILLYMSDTLEILPMDSMFFYPIDGINTSILENIIQNIDELKVIRNTPFNQNSTDKIKPKSNIENERKITKLIRDINNLKSFTKGISLKIDQVLKIHKNEISSTKQKTDMINSFEAIRNSINENIK
ncbi:MAG: hypothetical protein ABI844_07215 [Saprospiraceae bacterium]